MTAFVATSTRSGPIVLLFQYIIRFASLFPSRVSSFPFHYSLIHQPKLAVLTYLLHLLYCFLAFRLVTPLLPQLRPVLLQYFHLDYHCLLIMTPNWSVNVLDAPPLPIDPAVSVKSGSLIVVTSRPITSHVSGHSDNFNPLEVPDSQPTTTCERLHLLGLPGEIRCAIWRTIHNDVLLDTEGDWYVRPTTAWDGLRLSCQQIRVEIEDFWPRTIVPQSKIGDFLNQSFSLGIANNFRRLSLELPFDMNPVVYERLAESLALLSSCLEDLRLFFVGEDRHLVKAAAQGCGLRQTNITTLTSSLPLDGQFHEERQPLFTVLVFMYHLRYLVIENANYPLLQSMVIKNKPRLEYLHISTDPRSVLHQEHKHEGELYLIVSPRDNFPPVKLLHISTNAALTSFQIAVKVAPTLEELNWTVTDPSRQNWSFGWLKETETLFRIFSGYSPFLRTMRLCVHFGIYEAHPEYGDLIGGMNAYLPHFAALETLEVHIKSESPYFGQELIQALPNSIKRLYLSDKVITAQQLEVEVNKRYFTSHTGRRTNDAGHANRHWNSAFVLARDLPQQVNSSYPTPHGHMITRGGEPTFVEHEPVGEPYHSRRNDYISTGTGKLGFIGYEYYMNEDTKTILLNLNGRLLDRERNVHLALYDGGRHISPTRKVDAGTKVVKVHSPLNGKYGWDDPEADRVKELNRNMIAELQELEKIMRKTETGGTHRGYFGMECKAQEQFKREAVVQQIDLPRLLWPQEAVVGEKDHWLSEGGVAEFRVDGALEDEEDEVSDNEDEVSDTENYHAERKDSGIGMEIDIRKKVWSWDDGFVDI